MLMLDPLRDETATCCYIVHYLAGKGAVFAAANARVVV
jgi:hypothetical protein